MRRNSYRWLAITLFIIGVILTGKVEAKNVTKEASVIMELQKYSELYELNEEQQALLKPQLEKQYEIRVKIKNSNSDFKSDEIKKLKAEYTQCNEVMQNQITPKQKEKAKIKLDNQKAKIKEIERESKK